MTAITFIDTTLANYDELARAVAPGTEVVLIDGSRDGLVQVAQALAGRGGVEAVHVLGHGNEAVWALGSARVTADNLDSYAAELATIRAALTDDADLLLYGCDIAKGDDGQAFIEALAQATGADVAASTDLTGSALLGGDWTLEAYVGSIEAVLPANALDMAFYGGVMTLAQPVTTFVGIVNGNITPVASTGPVGSAVSVTNLIGSGWDFSIVAGATGSGQTYFRGITNLGGSADGNVLYAVGSLPQVKITANEGFTFDFTSIHFRIGSGYGTVRIYALDAAGQIKDPAGGYVDTYVPAAGGFVDSSSVAFNAAFNDISGIQFEWLADWNTNAPGGVYTPVRVLYLDTISVTDIRTAPVNTAPTIEGIIPTSAAVSIGLPSALPDFTVADADNDTLTVTLTSTNGTIGGLEDNDKTTAGIQLEGTAADINAKLAAATFTAPVGGAAAIGISVTDGKAAAPTTATLNLVALDRTAPHLASATVNGNALVLTYDEALDIHNPPAASTFAVTAGGAAATVTGMAVDGPGRTVTLTLASAVLPGQAVTVAYTDPTAGNDQAAIQDVAGNDAATLPATPVTNNTPDGTPPQLVSIERLAPADAVTNADSLAWRVTFSEAVRDVDATDFTVSGVTGAFITATPAGANAYDVTVSGGNLASLNGAVTLGFAQNHDIADLAGNALAGTVPVGANETSYQLDNTAPRVLAIERQVPADAVTDADSLTWRVSFDGAVTNVDAADFAVSGSSATVTNVAYVGDGAYDVTVSGGDLANLTGTVGLVFAPGQDVRDAAGNALHPLPIGASETYAVDNAAPAVDAITRVTPAAGITNADSLTYRVAFSKPVNHVDAADFTVAGTTANVTHVVDVGGNAYEITVAGGDLATLDGTVTLGFAAGHDIADLAGNMLASTTPAGTNDSAYTADNTAPRVASIVRQAPDGTNADTLTYRVTFDGAVLHLDAADFTVAGSTATVTNVMAAGGNAYDVTVAGGDLAGLNGTVTLAFAAGQNVTDAAGNALDATPAGSAETTYTVDNAVPRVASIVRAMPQAAVTDADALVFRVTFDGPVANLDAADFAVMGSTATVTHLVPAGANSYDVTVSGGDLANLNGTVGLVFAAGQDVRDAAGNPLDTVPVGAYETYTVDNNAPAVDAITHVAPIAGTTNADSLVYRVAFTRPVNHVDASDFTVSGTTATVTNVTFAGGYSYEVTVSGGDLATLDGTVTLGFAAGQDIASQAGSALASTTPAGINDSTYVIDNTAPRVAAIERVTPTAATTDADSLVYRVTFDGAVQHLDAADFSVSGTTATVTNVVAAGANVYEVTVSGGDLADLNGTVTLGFAGGHDVADAAGNALDIVPSGIDDASYTVRNVAPATRPATVAFSHDTGASPTDFVTATAAQAIGGTLTATLGADEQVRVSLDGGQTWTIATASGTAWSLAGATLAGSGTLQVKVTNTAGRDSQVLNQAYVLDTTAPLATATSAGFSADSGTSAADLVTKEAAQTVGGTLSAPLGAGETVHVSLDGGASWQAATVEGMQWSLGGVTLAGGGTLQVKVTDLAGNDGAVVAHQYTLDREAPGTTVSAIAISADSGKSATDFLTNVAAQTVTATLSAALGNDRLYGSADNGATWTDISTMVTGTALAWTGVTLAAGASALQLKVGDVAGNDGAVATQTYVLDTAAPLFQGAIVNGNKLALTYADAAALDASGAAAGAFAVTAAGRAVAVTGVTVDAAAHTVTLTLASAVARGQAVTVAYTDPSSGDDGLAIQDAAGNDAATLAPTPVLNNTPAQADNGGTAVTIDGVTVQMGQVTNADGSTSTVLTIPVVTATRDEQVGNNTVADIPLATNAAGATVLTAQVPVGYGLTVNTAAGTTAGTALTDLIREIKAHTEAGTGVQEQLTGGGNGFLADLPGGTALQVQTIVPTLGAGAAPAGALVIAGTPRSDGNPLTALVIDAGGVPAGSGIQLQNVEFAAVIGAVTVTGGDGSQTVWGDGASQTIVLGADDDVLHGGAGDDIVGSAGGNDQVFGDEGNDVVFGGIGDDHLDGGSGQDVARFGGTGRDGYSLRVKDGQLVITDLHGTDGTDTVANVETLRFTAADTGVRGTVTRLLEATTGSAPDLLTADRWTGAAADGKGAVAAALVADAGLDKLDTGAFVDTLYRNVLHRDADAAGKAYWSAALEAGTVSRGAMALLVADSAEKLALAEPVDLDFNDSDVALLVRMYGTLFDRQADEEGLNYWISMYEAGSTLADVADAFVASGEAAALYGGLGDGEFIDALYRSAFDRAAQPAEKAYWVDALAGGAIDRGDVLLGFANSAEKIALVGPIDTSVVTA